MIVLFLCLIIPGSLSQDPDFSSNKTEVGDELMKAQINQYVQSVISTLTTSSPPTQTKPPGVMRLLSYSNLIMQRTCPIVPSDYLDLSLNSVLNVQLNDYHVKEPYISSSSFKRIEQALVKCLKSAQPHEFTNTVNCGQPNATDNSTAPVPLPSWSSSKLNDSSYAEPLIETVWKMVVSTHSYCYSAFSDYYNDHHEYTTVILPFFNNEIQKIWLRGYELSNSTVLYGGLIQNVNVILDNVDKCVGASRANSKYPWIINRPPYLHSSSW